jgi:hypothetical protein
MSPPVATGAAPAPLNFPAGQVVAPPLASAAASQPAPVQPSATATPSPAAALVPASASPSPEPTLHAAPVVVAAGALSAATTAAGSPLGVQALTVFFLLAAGFVYFRFLGGKSAGTLSKTGK